MSTSNENLQSCLSGDCADHYGDPAAFCPKCKALAKERDYPNADYFLSCITCHLPFSGRKDHRVCRKCTAYSVRRSEAGVTHKSYEGALTLAVDFAREQFDDKVSAEHHIYALLTAMDKWASEEDGIHPDAFDVYEEARAFIGQPLPPNPDGRDDVMYKRTMPGKLKANQSARPTGDLRFFNCFWEGSIFYGHPANTPDGKDCIVRIGYVSEGCIYIIEPDSEGT